MPKASDIRIVSVQTATRRFAYRSPIKFGGRVVVDAVLAEVEVEVENRAGNRTKGKGAMPLGNVWAWPSQALDAGQTLSLMEDFLQRAAAQARSLREFGHPLELGHLLAAGHSALANNAASAIHAREPMPVLAQLVAASPLEAAIHDAYGRLLGTSAYNVLGADFVNSDLSVYLGPDFAGEYLDRYTLRQPKARMPLYHLVGALDPITPAEVARPVGDGLPETLSEWIQHDGLTHLKIKLNGDNLAWDVARVAAVEDCAAATQATRGCTAWNYSLDFNERCANVEYVLDFLRLLAERSPAALARVQYIEQPTHRDLRRFPENRMHAAARIKPVVIDESLIDFESLQLARQQGYSGVALKACKGHGEALLMGAAAQKYGLFLCVQDLTCVGYSFLHSASLAARIPTVAAIEGNGRQYCPAGNAEWVDRFPGMFQVRQGQVATSELAGNGLGF